MELKQVGVSEYEEACGQPGHLLTVQSLGTASNCYPQATLCQANTASSACLTSSRHLHEGAVSHL